MKKKSKGKYLKQTSRKNKIPLVLISVIALLGLLATGIFFITRLNNNNVTISNAEQAIYHAKKLGQEYGYENAMDELTEKNSTTVDGDSYYRLQQNYNGLPVYGRTVVYSTDKNGDILSITGNVMDVDELDLIPSISDSQVHRAIIDYSARELDMDNSAYSFEPVNAGNLCIYSMTDNYQCRLAYRVCDDYYEYIVDAHTAEILFVNSLIRFSDVQGALTGQVQSYPNIQYTQEHGLYSLKDSVRNISAYTANLDALVSWNEGAAPVLSAVDAYANFQIIYDFYNVVLGNKSYDGAGNKSIRIIVNADSLIDNAAFSPGEDVFKFGVASSGLHEKSIYRDWVAHEYTHGVEHLHSGMLYNGESGAIMEGLSDIFGEIVESWQSSNTSSVQFNVPNWHFSETNRYISDPERGKLPQKYKGRYWVDTSQISKDTDWGGVHYNNTVISHAAYLMWNGIDGSDEAAKIPLEKLANLWYRAMLMMPSDCSFIECRELVELAAKSLSLSSAQNNCISRAFDYVNISKKAEDDEPCDYYLANPFSLYVYDGNGRISDDYTVQINKAKSILGIYISKDTPDGFGITHEIDSSEPFVIDIEDGRYIFTIVNNKNPEETVRFTAKISAENEDFQDAVQIYTHFNTNHINGIIYEVINENGVEIQKPISNANVIIYSHDDALIIPAEFQTNIEGYFEWNLPYGNYTIAVNADGYTNVSHTFSLSDNSSEQIAICLTRSNYVELPEVFTCITSSLRTDWKIKTSSNGFFNSVVNIPDWGDFSSEYRNGTTYVTETSGQFIGLEKINDYSYEMHTSNVKASSQAGQIYISGDVRYVVEDNTNFDEGDKFYLYLPGTPTSMFPQTLIDSVYNNGLHTMEEITPNTYVLYHDIPESDGFDLVFIGTLNATQKEIPNIDANDINAINALLIGVGYPPDQAESAVTSWSDEQIFDIICRKRLWDWDATYLTKLGIGDEFSIDLSLAEELAQDMFGRSFPVNAQSGLGSVAGNKLNVELIMGESTELVVQNGSKQGNRITVVGLVYHHYVPFSEFCGYFSAELVENPSSIYGYTLTSIYRTEGNQNFDKLIASASSELKESSLYYSGK